MRFGVTLGVAAAVTLGSAASSAIGHSWYPPDCCNGRDCVVADALLRNSRGDVVVQVGPNSYNVPADLRRRSSPDNRIHVCIQEDEFGVRYLNCLFVPSAPAKPQLIN